MSNGDDDRSDGERKFGRRELRPRSRNVRRFGGRRGGRKGGGRKRGHPAGPRNEDRDRGPPRTDREERGPREDNGRVVIPREVVLPGDILGKVDIRVGKGAFKEGDTVYAAQLGVKSQSRDYVAVIPLAGRYIPKAGDEIIGKVVDIMPSNWLVDINSPYLAPLYANDTQWKVDFGETGRFLTVGDLILAEVSDVDFMKRIRLSMEGRGQRKLSKGHVIEISHSKVPRVIGKGGSMIKMLKDRTRCRIYVGQNGRIWLEGEPGNIMVAMEAIRIIEVNAHTLGLTERISRFLIDRMAPVTGATEGGEVNMEDDRGAGPDGHVDEGADDLEDSSLDDTGEERL
jgi:exosome complex component RRP4